MQSFLVKVYFLFIAFRRTRVFSSFLSKAFIGSRFFRSFSFWRIYEVWSFLVHFYLFFFKALRRTGVFKVVLFWKLSQGTLVVFLFKVCMRRAIFRVFFCIYTFLFKVLMRAGVFTVFSFIFIFYLKAFMGTKIFIKFSCQRFYGI